MQTIRLNKSTKTVKVVNRKDTVRLSKVESNIKLQRTGKPGPKGDQGDPGKDGVGIPSGGLPGQGLVKKSDSDYDVMWSVSEGEDKTYTQSFSMTDSIVVPHNLAKFPAVTVHDSAGDEVEGNVHHQTINQFVVTFSAPFSGVVTCN